MKTIYGAGMFCDETGKRIEPVKFTEIKCKMCGGMHNISGGGIITDPNNPTVGYIELECSKCKFTEHLCIMSAMMIE